MIAAATKALSWVSLEKLQPRHLKELAHAIHGALVDPVVSEKFEEPYDVYGSIRSVQETITQLGKGTSGLFERQLFSS